MPQIFGYISGVLSVCCFVPYIWDILKHKTKPERASWLIWSVLGVIAFFSQLNKGATDSLWLTGVQTIGLVLVFLLSLKYGVGGLTKKDMLALGVAFVGLVLWKITQEATIALILVIIIDVAGSLLTISKSYKDPGSETLVTWILSGTSGLFGALAVYKLDWVLLSYPVYLWLINYIIAGALILGRRKQIKERA